MKKFLPSVLNYLKEPQLEKFSNVKFENMKKMIKKRLDLIELENFKEGVATIKIDISDLKELNYRYMDSTYDLDGFGRSIDYDGDKVTSLDFHSKKIPNEVFKLFFNSDLSDLFSINLRDCISIDNDVFNFLEKLNVGSRLRFFDISNTSINYEGLIKILKIPFMKKIKNLSLNGLKIKVNLQEIANILPNLTHFYADKAIITDTFITGRKIHINFENTPHLDSLLNPQLDSMQKRAKELKYLGYKR